MKLLIFGGTTEGRVLAQQAGVLGVEVTVSVATELGAEELDGLSDVQVLTGRLDQSGMEALLPRFDLCVDATHPYAVQASETIRGACRGEGVPLLRLLRAACPVPEGAAVFASPAEAADWLRGTEGNILLATGAKELGAFAPLGGERLYPRVLPLADSLSACGAAGVPASHVIAMQGPFSRELNEALIRQFRIAYLVTKDGGRAGGFEEKAAAAKAAGARLILIRRPREDGLGYEDVLQQCREMMGCG